MWICCAIGARWCDLLLEFTYEFFFFFSSRRRHTRCLSDWSSDVCSSDLELPVRGGDLDAELVGDLHHVLAAAPQGGRRALERVATIEQQRAPAPLLADPRSEERRVGKECRSRWVRDR